MATTYTYGTIKDSGVSGQVLTSNGAGVAPSFQAVPNAGASFTYTAATTTTASVTTNTKYYVATGGAVTMTLAAPSATTNRVAFQAEGTGTLTITLSSTNCSIGNTNGTTSIVLGQGAGATGVNFIVLATLGTPSGGWMAESFSGYVVVS